MAITLRDAINDYGTWRLGQAACSPQTWRGESPGLYAFDRFLGSPRVLEVSRDDVSNWWDFIRTYADSTRATRLSQLRSFFSWAAKMGYRIDDPTAMIRAPHPAPEPRDRLNPDELLSLLDVTRTPRDRCLLALAMNLGLRGGEIARLKWRDIDWPGETLRVHIDKTDEVDDMPIGSDLMRELTTWVASAVTWGSFLGVDPDSYLIPSQHIGAQGVTYRWDKPVAEPYTVVQFALSKIGWLDITQEGVHTIRRSVARIYFDMIEETESFDSALLATMTLLHHTRPDTTLTYIGRDRATLARDRIIRGKPFLSAMRTVPTLSVVAS